MHAYWMTGSLRLHPETNEERDALDLILKSVKVSVPPEFREQSHRRCSTVEKRLAGGAVEEIVPGRPAHFHDEEPIN